MNVYAKSLGCTVAAAVLGLGTALGQPTEAIPTVQPTAGLQVANGVIAKLDVRDRRFVLVANDRETPLAYAAETLFLIEGRLAFEGTVMKEGMPVIVKFVDHLAVEINARPARE